MKQYRAFAALLTALIIVPTLIIPSNWGISLTEMNMNLDRSGPSGSEATRTVYILLDTYYLLFMSTMVAPFVFFTISSTLSLWRSRRSLRGRKIKEGIPKKRAADLDVEIPKVSIIIPCYNEAGHVSSTITSCFRQDYPGDIEIIVVDDGSRDETWSIGKIFKTAEKGREIRLIHKENGGKASALKKGIEASTGSIILMTDGDSNVQPHAVSAIVETFREYPDAGIVGGYVFIRNSDSSYLTRLQQLEYIVTQHLIRINQGEDGSVLIAPGPIFGMRADLARALPPLDRTIVEDCDLTLTVLSTIYTTRTTVKAVSQTTAPVDISGWIGQRKRWVYGQFQAWRENRWHLKRNPWGVYTYFTWLTTTASSLTLIGTVLLTLIFFFIDADLYRFLEFISIRSGVIIAIYFISRILVLVHYPEGRRSVHYLPLMMVYDIFSGFFTSYLYIRFITGMGVRIGWGKRSGVVH